MVMKFGNLSMLEHAYNNKINIMNQPEYGLKLFLKLSDFGKFRKVIFFS